MRRFNTFYIQILPKLEGKELIQYYTFKMQPQQFMAFMKHLLVGLNYMHKRDIVHFDIKQENISGMAQISLAILIYAILIMDYLIYLLI